MYHHDFMRSIMRDRARERREEARAFHARRLVRRAREYWAERAELADRPVRRRSGRGAARAS